jgi:beta-N-acetylhexosaminidase
MYRLPRSAFAASLCAALAGVGPMVSLAGSSVAAADVATLPTVNAVATTPAQNVFSRMTPAQRVGQLFMVGGPVTGLTSATKSTISRSHVGNLILTGRTTAGASAVRAVTSASDALATPAATAGVPLFIASDQEGGLVQVLQGPGFSRMPTALTQGTWPDSTLTSNAAVWGRQVLRAGVDVNLAPVMDTVSRSFAPKNAPIGKFFREYGFTPATVADKGTAFLRGMRSTGMATTAKHFPGLGRVVGNTDTTSGVTDTVTTRLSSDIVPFRAAVAAGAPFLMVSSAIYSKIDAQHPAVFSSTVITGMIRGDLRFRGVVVSDDLGNAKQVQGWSPGARAVNFIGAGGDMVLTVSPSVLPAMVAAVSARAASDSVFRAKVNAAALRVLSAKANLGLLGARLNADGSLGPVTIAALQRWLGVAQSGQLTASTVRALQVRIGTSADGIWGPTSMAALQSYLGTHRDGATTWNSRTVSLLQMYLNTQL